MSSLGADHLYRTRITAFRYLPVKADEHYYFKVLLLIFTRDFRYHPAAKHNGGRPKLKILCGNGCVSISWHLHYDLYNMKYCSEPGYIHLLEIGAAFEQNY